MLAAVASLGARKRLGCGGGHPLPCEPLETLLGLLPALRAANTESDTYPTLAA